MESRDKDAGQISIYWPLAISAYAALLLAFLLFGAKWYPSLEEIDKLGQMGDFFGGMLNPLVSGLTLFVAISVWQLQKKELQATKTALDEQAKTAEQQRQEQRFFDLLNVYQRTVDSISVTRPSGVGEGSLEFLISNGKPAITDWLRKTHLDKIALSIGSGLAKHSVETQRKNQDAPSLFDHYFRVIFHILTEAEVLLGDQHIRYIQLFRAQLSRSELIILAYTLWMDDRDKMMLPLAEKYGLLKHLPEGQLRTELEKLHPKVFDHQPEASL